jgi:hypothetical protein
LLTWTQNTISINAFYLDCSSGILQQVETQALDIFLKETNVKTSATLQTNYQLMGAGEKVFSFSFEKFTRTPGVYYSLSL